MRSIWKVIGLSVLMLSLAGGALSQPSDPPEQGAKSDIKDAGHDTKQAVKKTGRAIKKGAKKGTHAAAKKTRQGSEKVEDKTSSPQ